MSRSFISAGDRRSAAAGKKLALKIARRKTEIVKIKDARPRPLHQAQGIKLGEQMAAVGPDLDEARDGGLLGTGGAVSRRLRRRETLRARPWRV
jgi:hypothetical protein